MIYYRPERPKDYHCHCLFCAGLFRGELIKEDGTYYSARERSGYSEYEKKHKHLDKGHWQGFAFAIQQYTEPGDVVFDPMAGSGTTIVEALKQNREGWGIELEYFNILKENCHFAVQNSDADFLILNGDARDRIELLDRNTVDLVVTGPVYNNNSDAPERKILKGEDKSFNYSKDLPNLAWLKDKEYYRELERLYRDVVRKMKKGAKFAIIIKDPIRNQKPYLLHTHIGSILKDLGLVPKDVWIHRHWPPTLFMNTYSKRFPDADIPLYQTIVVFEKK